MDFTREPIIETIITPREGYRLVIRSSKSMGQEEHFVEAVEVVSFGNAFFFRSTERPKPFLVPVADYEVLEVREQRLVLKAQSPESSVKIGGGREAAGRPYREDSRREDSRREDSRRDESRRNEPKPESRPAPVAVSAEESGEEMGGSAEARPQGEGRSDKRRDRRQRFRRRGDRRGAPANGAAPDMMEGEGEGEREGENSPAVATRAPAPGRVEERERERGRERERERTQDSSAAEPIVPPPILRAVLPPPATLIRDDLQRLRDSDAYRGAFFIREDQGDDQDDDDASLQSIESDPTLATALKEKKESSFEEESFLFSQAHDAQTSRDSPRDSSRDFT